MDYGQIWLPITNSTPNDGMYDWLVPSIESDSSMVRITDNINTNFVDISHFRIGENTHILDLQLIFFF